MHLQFTNRQELLDNITISDWILPAVYQGHFTTVVWMKPPWATQIPVGEHEIVLGVDNTGLLKTSSILPYYLSDLSSDDDLHHRRYDYDTIYCFVTVEGLNLIIFVQKYINSFQHVIYNGLGELKKNQDDTKNSNETIP